MLSLAVLRVLCAHPWFPVPEVFGQNNKTEKGAGEKWIFTPWGRGQTQVPSRSPVPTTAPQGGTSPEVLPGGVFPSKPGTQISPQKPRAPISPPLSPFAADFSHFSPITCLDSWVCQPPTPGTEVSGSGRAGDAPRGARWPGCGVRGCLAVQPPASSPAADSSPCPRPRTVGHLGCRHQRDCFNGGSSVGG